MTKKATLTNLQKFHAAMKEINDELASVSRKSQAMARAGSATLSNAEFRELMRLHEELKRSAESLLERFAELSVDD